MESLEEEQKREQLEAELLKNENISANSASMVVAKRIIKFCEKMFR